MITPIRRNAVGPKRVLLVAYHFPPCSGSSGLQRTLRFAEYLPEYGWEPTVLSVRPAAYEAVDHASAPRPAGYEVVRTFCLDAARHLSIAKRYPRFAATPDRWASWRLWGVRAGIRAVRDRGIQAVWSTYPIATAHAIASRIAARTSIPWIADFRDPMAQEGYPADPRQWRAFKRIEEDAAEHAARLVFVSPSARTMYRERYASRGQEDFVLLENGYDEDSFLGLGHPAQGEARRSHGGPLTLLHSGIVYPSERDPTALFEAMGRLARAGRIQPGDFVIRFRAAVHEDLLDSLAKQHRVEPFVEICPPVPYQDALREMVEADALLVLQGMNVNRQVPAKVYEYLRAGRPIIALTDPAGDTGQLLAALGLPPGVPLESAAAIESAFPALIAALKTESLAVADPGLLGAYSRRALTGRLATLLDEVVDRAQAGHGRH